MVRVLIPLLAGCSLLASLIATIVTLDFLRDAKHTTGTIVDMQTTTNDDGKLLYKPTFTFAVDGREYTVTPFGHVSPPAGHVGDRIGVLYDPSRPSNARINTFAYTWQTPVVTFVFACVFGLISLAMAWFTRNFRYVGTRSG